MTALGHPRNVCVASNLLEVGSVRCYDRAHTAGRFCSAQCVRRPLTATQCPSSAWRRKCSSVSVRWTSRSHAAQCQASSTAVGCRRSHCLGHLKLNSQEILAWVFQGDSGSGVIMPFLPLYSPALPVGIGGERYHSLLTITSRRSLPRSIVRGAEGKIGAVQLLIGCLLRSGVANGNGTQLLDRSH